MSVQKRNVDRFFSIVLGPTNKKVTERFSQTRSRKQFVFLDWQDGNCVDFEFKSHRFIRFLRFSVRISGWSTLVFSYPVPLFLMDSPFFQG